MKRTDDMIRIELDWTRLLGFDTCNGDRGLNAKVGAKQMLRRPGELDSVALARLSKVGLKGT
jgi:hypothetical protein